MEEADWASVELKPVDENLLVAPAKRRFGPGMEPDLEYKGVRIRIGTRPYAWNLRQAYEAHGGKVPPKIDLFDSYDIWIVNQIISVISEGRSSVQTVGYVSSFSDKPRITVLSVLPDSDFVTLGKVGAYCTAGISLTGKASTKDVFAESELAGLPMEGKAEIAAGVDVALKVGMAIITSRVQATGAGHNGGEWLLKKGERPLLGNQTFMQVVLTRRRLEELTFTARVYAIISGFFGVPVRIESGEMALSCELK